MGCKTLVTAKTGIDFLLLVNLSIAIFVTCWVTKSPRNETIQQWNNFQTSIEKIYEDFVETPSTQTRTSKRVRAAPSLEFLSLLKPVVHLAGLDFDRTVKSADTNISSPIRNWAVSEGSERNLMYNGMTYENGSIIVPVTGVYFMYSHTKFYVEDNKKAGKQNDFYHAIFGYNVLSKTENELLSNEVTECKEGINDGAHLEYPSDTRGLVQLDAGDQIIVKVSNFELLKHDRDWHYIGLYLV